MASGGSANISWIIVGGCGASLRRKRSPGSNGRSSRARRAFRTAPFRGRRRARWRAAVSQSAGAGTGARFFSQLRIWDTVHNNGVLIYLLLADRDFEIVADRGIDEKVGAAGWKKVCVKMESNSAPDFSRGRDQGNPGGFAAIGHALPGRTGRAE